VVPKVFAGKEFPPALAVIGRHLSNNRLVPFDQIGRTVMDGLRVSGDSSLDLRPNAGLRQPVVTDQVAKVEEDETQRD